MKDIQEEYGNLQQLYDFKEQSVSEADKTESERKKRQEREEEQRVKLHWTRQKDLDLQESTISTRSQQVIDQAGTFVTSVQKSFATESGNLKFLRANLRNVSDTSIAMYNDVKDIKNMLGVLVPVIIGM